MNFKILSCIFLIYLIVTPILGSLIIVSDNAATGERRQILINLLTGTVANKKERGRLTPEQLQKFIKVQVDLPILARDFPNDTKSIPDTIQYIVVDTSNGIEIRWNQGHDNGNEDLQFIARIIALD
ncbi:hypothetical protein DFA_00556 [Cavenderia fasciculata]|uniref:Uncharacterized protein n=1 Tax=Cavenderia fasciculata TaxID=261658 RepID=F4PSK3_CACFS|nr:uncharacterized protein DFA_00556 [Cavenderia fasciculata]EGG20695.1 hypothetical protein DFA_00556 [Cavenderia fasciculata]|eukprot:XP_004358545.1 hypothetical protein DFA_00556 [Cavenderia fasciculata]